VRGDTLRDVELIFEYIEHNECDAALLNITLNILRVHQIWRPKESFYISLMLSPVDLIPCY